MSLRHRLVLAALASSLLVGAVGCAESSDSDTSNANSSSTVDAPASSDPEADDAGSEPSNDGESPAPAADLSAVKLADGTADPDATATFTADGAFDRDSIEVGVGELVTFKADADAGTHAVTFNGSDTYTISGGLIETFAISAPGEYVASELLTDATVTITVTP